MGNNPSIPEFLLRIRSNCCVFALIEEEEEDIWDEENKEEYMNPSLNSDPTA